ncbi:hypothetical protein [Pseudooceanicola atlanticus]|nr:hypothetical protein [Pseudooceanicola atlanticus]
MAPRLLVLIGAALIALKTYGGVALVPDPLQTTVGGILGLAGVAWYILAYRKLRKEP